MLCRCGVFKTLARIRELSEQHFPVLLEADVS